MMANHDLLDWNINAFWSELLMMANHHLNWAEILMMANHHLLD